MQVGFIDMICLPLYRVLSDTFPWIQPLYTGTAENRKRWQDLAEKVEMGLTWIDHDTIDKPIEEFTGKILNYVSFFLIFLYFGCYCFLSKSYFEFTKTKRWEKSNKKNIYVYINF